MRLSADFRHKYIRVFSFEKLIDKEYIFEYYNDDMQELCSTTHNLSGGEGGRFTGVKPSSFHESFYPGPNSYSCNFLWRH